MYSKVEKGIPIPEKKPKYPFAEMEVGDSFRVDKVDAQKVRVASALYSSRKNQCAKFKIGVSIRTKYETATIEEWRCWRVR
jgi:hypothetical protein